MFNVLIRTRFQRLCWHPSFLERFQTESEPLLNLHQKASHCIARKPVPDEYVYLDSIYLKHPKTSFFFLLELLKKRRPQEEKNIYYLEV